MTVVRLANEFDDGWVPLRSDFEYREPGCANDYEAVFGRHLNFDARQIAIWLRSEVHKSRSDAVDEMLIAVLEGIVEREIASLEKLTEIEHLLGFSELSAFTRAARL